MSNRSSNESSTQDEEEIRLLATLLCNRAGAFVQCGRFEDALADGRQALALRGREAWSTAHLRVGTALLGLGRHQEAYHHFVRVVQGLSNKAPEDHPARRGLAACLSLGLGDTGTAAFAPGEDRCERELRDSSRLRYITRIFYISDIHFEHPEADDWVDRISDTAFLEDVLIVPGNVAQTLAKLRACLRLLRAKFRRVFFVPGNEDLWLHNQDKGQKVHDSIDKLWKILQICEEEDIDTGPATLCNGVHVVPLFSWYNADFDEMDPFPSDTYGFDPHCRWPFQKDTEVWRYMLYLNKPRLQRKRGGTVITFSHFLPRTELPFWNHIPGLAKGVGCPQLEAQLRRAGSSCHLFGHSHLFCNTLLDGVRYMQHHLGYEGDHQEDEPLLCIFDGSKTGGFGPSSESGEDPNLCARCWPLDGELDIG